MFWKLVFKYWFRIEKETVVPLGNSLQSGGLFVVIDLIKVWKNELMYIKIKSIIKREWQPKEETLSIVSKRVFMKDIFGDEEDFGEELFRLQIWHHCQDWNLNNLTELDIQRAKAIQATSVLTITRFKQGSSKYLHLNLLQNAPLICTLAFPMIVKIPVFSFQYFLNIQLDFTFNSIRKAHHPYADDLIAYLYEILYLQQKISTSLNEYLRLVDYTNRNKSHNLIIEAETNAILYADLVLSYLKATMEKTIMIIGLTHGIKNLDSKGRYQNRLDRLQKELPQKVTGLYYWKFIYEFISSENIDEINNYRTGLLHKKGISDLQPHNYFGKNPEEIPLLKIFKVLQEQHSKNTAVLVAAFAILTDKLVELDPPNVKMEDIFNIMKSENFTRFKHYISSNLKNNVSK